MASSVNRGADAPLFVLIAGERSGDGLAAGLIRALHRHYPRARFAGVTGPEMRAAGCESLADIDELSLLGLAEVIGEIPRVLRLRRRLFAYTRAARPAAFIGVDAPAFNTALERRLRKAGITTVHYVCPTAWAWRERRVRSLARAADLMLAIFPFEDDFFRARGVPVTFVGQPLADVPPPHPDAAAARRALGLSLSGLLVGLLPGSRRSEVIRLGPCFAQTARWLARRMPAVQFATPIAAPALRPLWTATLARHAPDIQITLIDGRAREIMGAADVLLVASGTATLEALLAKTPMVVAYRLSPGSYWMVRGLNLIKVRYVSMPNLLAGRALVPEFLQGEAQPAAMGAALARLLSSPAARAAQTSAFEAIHARLAQNADARAAQAIADLLEKRA